MWSGFATQVYTDICMFCGEGGGGFGVHVFYKKNIKKIIDAEIYLAGGFSLESVYVGA